MLKQITWPAPLELKPGEITRTSQQLLLDMVMNQAYWRESAERNEQGDAICDQLEKGGETTLLTPGQREVLIGSMKLEGQQITPAIVNRYYLRMLRAVYQATDVKEG